MCHCAMYVCIIMYASLFVWGRNASKPCHEPTLDIVAGMPKSPKKFFKNTKIYLFFQKYKNGHFYVFQWYNLNLYHWYRNLIPFLRLCVSFTVQSAVQSTRVCHLLYSMLYSVSTGPPLFVAMNIYIFVFLLVRCDKIVLERFISSNFFLYLTGCWPPPPLCVQ